MSKKIFGTIAIAIVVLAFFVTGCDTPTTNEDADYTKTRDEVIPSIGDPVVEAKTWDGIILVSWLPLKDVAKYSIWRRHNKTGEIKDLGNVDVKTGTPPDLTRYIDVVSFTNQLVNGDSYTYKVVAQSGNTTVPFARATYAEPGVIFNGEGSVTVTARVPDRARYTLTAVKDTDIKIERLDYYNGVTAGSITNTGPSDRILVTWPTQPNAKYTVRYTLGQAQSIVIADGTTTSLVNSDTNALVISNANPGYENPIGYASFPIIAGNNTVTIITEFLGGPYYNSVQSTAVNVDGYALLKLDDVTLTATYVGTSSASPNGYVTLSYTEVAGAASYDIYKAIIGTETGANSNYTTIGDWAPVTYTVTAKSAPTYTNGTPLSTITAREELTAQVNGQKYAYMLIAKGPAPAAATDPQPQSRPYITALVTPATSTTAFAATQFTSYFDGNDKTKPAYEITLTPGAPNETYKLERAALTFLPNEAPSVTSGSDTIKSVGTPVEVPQASFAYPAAGSVWNAPIIIHDTGVSARTGYRYILTITKDGLTTVKSVDIIGSAVTDPFYLRAPFSSLSVSAVPFVSDDPGTPTVDETNDISGVNSVRVTISYASGAYLTDKPSLTLLYRKTTDSIETAYTAYDLGDLYYGENQTPHTTLRVVTVGSLDPLASYDFRLKVGNDLYNTYAQNNVTPSRNTLASIGTLIDNTNNTFSLSNVTGTFVPGTYDIRLVRSASNPTPTPGTADTLNTAVTLKRSWTAPPAGTDYESTAPVSFASLPGTTADPVVYDVWIKARWEADDNSSLGSITANGWYKIGTTVTKQ